MEPMINVLITALISFLVGSIPTGFLVAKLKGIDIRSQGSGNIGATNAFRVLGKVWGSFVLTFDILKGMLPVLLVAFLFKDQPNIITLKLVAAVCTVLGHNYTPWLGFKGGKGIATSAGALIGLMPVVSVMVIVVFIVVFKISRYVSLGSIIAAAALPLVTALFYWGMPEFLPFTIFASVLGILAIVRHKSNIRRLINGTENRFGQKKQELSDQ
ncbi:MAG: glycerol-3-phosphate 1-O-acyltransferase PlsY [Verrucomicrobiota bacterium]|nr:glycerol-3-phosphate 1-O-acyltransferase PlsY [Verrucomicrobiota bacterium]